jgi:hypothetical protein
MKIITKNPAIDAFQAPLKKDLNGSRLWEVLPHWLKSAAPGVLTKSGGIVEFGDKDVPPGYWFVQHQDGNIDILSDGVFRSRYAVER